MNKLLTNEFLVGGVEENLHRTMRMKLDMELEGAEPWLAR
jgi:hypothetical protein